ncbi:MAG: PIN domain-containing protein [Bacteroidetes bacterium]|nr:MAG: PIN domain-containing protein [Bacteroidota bacterium]
MSIISELELYGFKKLTKAERVKIEKVLSQCTIIDINAGIKSKAIEVRQNQGLKLPDCIIAGTALYLDIPLFSADKDFSKI